MKKMAEVLKLFGPPKLKFSFISFLVVESLPVGERNMEIPFENPCPGRANGLPAYYFTQAVQMLLATHCMLGDPEDYPKSYAGLVNNEEFDFIVVGGGSSGSVIANRLSEMKNWKILLIEAGGDPTFESDIPGFSLSLPGRELDWKFCTNYSKYSCQGMEEESCAIFQGKVLGGSSTINTMHYVRGNAQDFEEWERLGNKGWSYNEVLPYFKKSEKLDEDFKIFKHTEYKKIFNKMKKEAGGDKRKLYEVYKMVAGRYHSKAGVFSVNHFAYNARLWKMKKNLCDAAEELEVPCIADVNGASQIGFAQVMGAIHEANRGNTAKGFLTPIKNRQNLFVIKNATVQKLILDGKKVTGVLVLQNSTLNTIHAKKEVIVCAGAINSPKLLLLSGIGPQHLNKVGVNIIHDLPGVGENMQAHVTFFGLPFVIEKAKSKQITHLQKIDAMYYFISRGTGFFGSIGLNDMVGFINTERNNSVPDIEFLHYVNHIKDYYTLNELLISLKFKNEIRDQFAKAYANSNLLLICPTLLRPKSTGRIELTGSRFSDPPKIIANFLKDSEDIITLIKGIKFGINLTETKAFEELEPELLKVEIEGCKKFKFKSDEYWECLLRYMTSSMHDIAGTCKMGLREDPFAVVDDKLKVHGIEGLRVADSSIMPFIVRGSTSVVSVMIGERVSDFIKDDWRNIKHEEL